MAAPDYSGILSAFKTIIEADSRIEALGVKVYVEQDPVFGMPDDGGRAVVLLLNNRRMDPGQSMSAGKRTRYILRWSAWAACFDMNSYREAAIKRDEVLGILELILMANRTIDGLVTASQLSGGEFMSSRNADESAFVAMAETVMESEVSAINP